MRRALLIASLCVMLFTSPLRDVLNGTPPPVIQVRPGRPIPPVPLLPGHPPICYELRWVWCKQG